MNKGQQYLKYASDVLLEILDKEQENIHKAAVAVKETTKNGGMLYTFGTGHSVMLCNEPFFRAGGMAACYPIIDSRFSPNGQNRSHRDRVLEREEGITEGIFKEYPLKKGDTMIIYNYGGRNSTSVDAGILCKEIGVTTIDITSLDHATHVPSIHSTGKMVQDVCDIVIDNHGPLGDASIDFGGYKVGPISTVVGAGITQAIICEAAELCLAEGIDPEILVSMNVPGGDEHNKKYIEKYSPIIKWL